jgi:23S rRNA (cytidine1920-2'-O)/16S rRNA (cytidine1409-2'-O)-methyltransferase
MLNVMDNPQEGPIRLDKSLVIRGLALSRARAVTMIEEGKVLVNGAIVRDSSRSVGEKDVVSLSAPDMPWVSRAALKLIAALDEWGVDPSAKVALDIGASTGGFTQVLLAGGASRVYAVDVGHGQLADVLLHDQRVFNMERTHILELPLAVLDPRPDMIVSDVSFISLTKVLPKIAEILPPHGFAVCLIKPQFEVGRDAIGKGVVRDPVLHDAVCERMRRQSGELGFSDIRIIPSPITGGDGNKEFLMYLSWGVFSSVR